MQNTSNLYLPSECVNGVLHYERINPGISKKNARLSRKTRSLLQFLTVTPLFVNYFKILCCVS
ncbi:hypothetical protein A9J90_06625 [Escherichia coli]|nr:hypothetical protein A9J90_06625 [Escherichia coli]